MLENIVRHMEMGKPRIQAALEGAEEVGFTILSMTLSLAAVFIPLMFMGGIIGRLFHEFGVTIERGDPRLGVRVADADADAVQPVPEPGPGRRGTADLPDGRARSSTAPSHAYERSLAWVMQPPAPHARLLGADPRR